MAVAATTPIQLGHVNPRSEVVLELMDEHYPLLLVRWAGQVQPQHVLQMMRFFDSTGALAEAEGTSLIYMLDAREAALPNALVRDMLVDWLATRRRAGMILKTFVIAPDPLIRGVVTSLKWATGRADGITVVTKIDAAIEASRQLFEAANIEVPAVLAR